MDEGQDPFSIIMREIKQEMPDDESQISEMECYEVSGIKEEADDALEDEVEMIEVHDVKRINKSFSVIDESSQGCTKGSTILPELSHSIGRKREGHLVSGTPNDDELEQPLSCVPSQGSSRLSAIPCESSDNDRHLDGYLGLGTPNDASIHLSTHQSSTIPHEPSTIDDHLDEPIGSLSPKYGPSRGSTSGSSVPGDPSDNERHLQGYLGSSGTQHDEFVQSSSCDSSLRTTMVSTSELSETPSGQTSSLNDTRNTFEVLQSVHPPRKKVRLEEKRQQFIKKSGPSPKAKQESVDSLLRNAHELAICIGCQVFLYMKDRHSKITYWGTDAALQIFQSTVESLIESTRSNQRSRRTRRIKSAKPDVEELAGESGGSRNSNDSMVISSTSGEPSVGSSGAISARNQSPPKCPPQTSEGYTSQKLQAIPERRTGVERKGRVLSGNTIDITIVAEQNLQFISDSHLRHKTKSMIVHSLFMKGQQFTETPKCQLFIYVKDEFSIPIYWGTSDVKELFRSKVVRRVDFIVPSNPEQTPAAASHETLDSEGFGEGHLGSGTQSDDQVQIPPGESSERSTRTSYSRAPCEPSNIDRHRKGHIESVKSEEGLEQSLMCESSHGSTNMPTAPGECLDVDSNSKGHLESDKSEEGLEQSLMCESSRGSSSMPRAPCERLDIDSNSKCHLESDKSKEGLEQSFMCESSQRSTNTPTAPCENSDMDRNLESHVVPGELSQGSTSSSTVPCEPSDFDSHVEENQGLDKPKEDFVQPLQLRPAQGSRGGSTSPCEPLDNDGQPRGHLGSGTPKDDLIQSLSCESYEGSRSGSSSEITDSKSGQPPILQKDTLSTNREKIVFVGVKHQLLENNTLRSQARYRQTNSIFRRAHALVERTRCELFLFVKDEYAKTTYWGTPEVLQLTQPVIDSLTEADPKAAFQRIKFVDPPKQSQGTTSEVSDEEAESDGSDVLNDDSNDQMQISNTAVGSSVVLKSGRILAASRSSTDSPRKRSLRSRPPVKSGRKLKAPVESKTKAIYGINEKKLIVKMHWEFEENVNARHVVLSRRIRGLMKKGHQLAETTNCQVIVLMRNGLSKITYWGTKDALQLFQPMVDVLGKLVWRVNLLYHPKVNSQKPSEGRPCIVKELQWLEGKTCRLVQNTVLRAKSKYRRVIGVYKKAHVFAGHTGCELFLYMKDEFARVTYWGTAGVLPLFQPVIDSLIEADPKSVIRIVKFVDLPKQSQGATNVNIEETDEDLLDKADGSETSNDESNDQMQISNSASGSNDHMQISNSASGSNDHIGISNSASGSNDHIGISNSTSGSNDQMQISNSSSGSNDHMQISNSASGSNDHMQIPNSASGSNDHMQIPNSASGLNDHMQISNSASGLNDHMQIPNSASGLNDHMQISNSASGLNDHMQIPNSASGSNDHMQISNSASGSNDQMQISNSTSGSNDHMQISNSASGSNDHMQISNSASGSNDHMQISNSASGLNDHMQIPNSASGLNDHMQISNSASGLNDHMQIPNSASGSNDHMQISNSASGSNDQMQISNSTSGSNDHMQISNSASGSNDHMQISNSASGSNDHIQISNSASGSNDQMQISNSASGSNDHMQISNSASGSNDHIQISNSASGSNDHMQISNSASGSNDHMQISNSTSGSNDHMQISNSASGSNDQMQISNSASGSNDHIQISNSASGSNDQMQISNSVSGSNDQLQISNSPSISMVVSSGKLLATNPSSLNSPRSRYPVKSEQKLDSQVGSRTTLSGCIKEKEITVDGKPAFVDNFKARTRIKSNRVRSLFRKGHQLAVMTNSQVIILVKDEFSKTTYWGTKDVVELFQSKINLLGKVVRRVDFVSSFKVNSQGEVLWEPSDIDRQAGGHHESDKPNSDIVQSSMFQPAQGPRSTSELAGSVSGQPSQGPRSPSELAGSVSGQPSQGPRSTSELAGSVSGQPSQGPQSTSELAGSVSRQPSQGPRSTSELAGSVSGQPSQGPSSTSELAGNMSGQAFQGPRSTSKLAGSLSRQTPPNRKHTQIKPKMLQVTTKVLIGKKCKLIENTSYRMRNQSRNRSGFYKMALAFVERTGCEVFVYVKNESSRITYWGTGSVLLAFQPVMDTLIKAERIKFVASPRRQCQRTPSADTGGSAKDMLLGKADGSDTSNDKSKDDEMQMSNSANESSVGSSGMVSSTNQSSQMSPQSKSPVSVQEVEAPVDSRCVGKHKPTSGSTKERKVIVNRKLGYSENKDLRTKVKSRRIWTLFRKGHKLAETTNCQVYILVRDDLSKTTFWGTKDALQLFQQTLDTFIEKGPRLVQTVKFSVT